MRPPLLPRLLVPRLPFFYGWVVLGCICLAGFARQGPAVAVLSLFVVPMTEAFGWSRTEMSGAVSLGGVLAAFISPLLGPVLDRRGARLILCLAVLGTGFATMALSLTQSLVVFYLLFCFARMIWAGPFDLGPQVFFGVGAYTAALLFVRLGLDAWLGLPAAVAVAVVVCALLTYPLTRLRGHYFAIATVAIWMIAQPIGATWEFIGGSQGLFIPVKPRASVAASALSLQFSGPTKALGYYYSALALFALTLALMALVERSKLGYYFRAIRDDQEAAEGIGIDSRLYKVLARSITAAVFAAAGVLYAFWALSVFPEQVLELNWSTLPIMATVVGGIGRLWGPVLGAVILIPIAQIMSTTLGTGPLAGRGIDLIVYGIIIVLIAAFRPTGLLSLPWGRWFRRRRPATPAPAP